MNREPDHRLRRRRDQDDGMVGLPLPRPGPKTVFAFSWWVVGLYVLFFAKGLTPSPESEQKYSELMQQAVFSNEAREMEEHVRSAMRHLDKVHVWGWRWREPYASLVPERMAELEMAQRNLEQALAERNALISEAKGAVGIWSTHGVEDVRDRFWKAYQSGKDFAQRMSWWDTAFVFMGRGSRDEEAALTLLRWVGQIMMNFTVGLLSALVSFGFSLVGMIWEYKTSLFGGLLFFTVAFSAAASMVAAFIGGMVASAVGGVYLIDKQARRMLRTITVRFARRNVVGSLLCFLDVQVRNARLEGRAGDQRRYVRNREYHYD